MTQSPPFVIRMNDAGTYVLNVQPDSASLLRLAADAVAFFGRKAIERRGRFHLALSGGNTPRALFELLARPPYVERVYWDRVHVWWGDERAVPSDAPESNYRMAEQALLRHVPIPPGQVHRVRTELGAEQAAAHYETEIKFAFGQISVDAETGALLDGAGIPVFDMILLGMGEDGHTASLFPHSEALAAHERLVVSHFVEQAGMQRITFTAPLINAGDTVLFLVSGASKAPMLKRVLLGEYAPDALPAQQIAPAGKLFWMTDAEAAAEAAPKPGYPDGEFVYRRIQSTD